MDLEMLYWKHRVEIVTILHGIITTLTSRQVIFRSWYVVGLSAMTRMLACLPSTEATATVMRIATAAFVRA